MDARQRLAAAIAMQPVDRVPVAPVVLFFAARQAGLSMARFLTDRRAAFRALVHTFDALGGWDAQVIPGTYDPLLQSLVTPARMALPGRELAPDAIWQVEEFEAMKAEDYAVVADRGWFRCLLGRIVPRLFPGVGGSFRGLARLVGRALPPALGMYREVRYWERRGVPVLVGAAINVPLDTLCFARSLRPFVTDLYRRPEQVIAAMERMVPELVRFALTLARLNGIPRVFIGGARGSGRFLSPRQYERFYLPFLKEVVTALHRRGVVSLLHFDDDWTAHLSSFKELPRASCILELDGSTDIFRAKEVLGGHLCLMGDVPPALLRLGTPRQVGDYCRRLIAEVGAGGGFILSSGCEVPHDAPPENVRAMLTAVRT
jgi:hypothetical protein